MCVLPFLQSPICVADLCALLLHCVRAYALLLSNADSRSLQRSGRAQIPLSELPCLGYTRPRRVHLGVCLTPKILSVKADIIYYRPRLRPRRRRIESLPAHPTLPTRIQRYLFNYARPPACYQLDASSQLRASTSRRLVIGRQLRANWGGGYGRVGLHRVRSGRARAPGLLQA
ncbi:hypothetical protein C8R44DRAFT_754005 [Mycena epipterygia]|nr:hypothetical protein C8R44DRAFT_754005 [Mycena epipterygia]